MLLLSHQSVVVVSELHQRNCQLHAAVTLSLGANPVENKSILFKQYCITCHYAHKLLLCAYLGHLKVINFPFVPNGKFIIFRYPNTEEHYSIV